MDGSGYLIIMALAAIGIKIRVHRRKELAKRRKETLGELAKTLRATQDEAAAREFVKESQKES